MSVNSTNPTVLFGGTWEQINGRFLYATTTSKKTGGVSSVDYTPSGTVGNHTLTLAEIPKYDLWLSTSDYSPKVKFNINTGTGYGMNTWNNTATSGHNHGFTGTKATINTMPPWFSVYCWYRTA